MAQLDAGRASERIKGLQSGNAGTSWKELIELGRGRLVQPQKSIKDSKCSSCTQAGCFQTTIQVNCSAGTTVVYVLFCAWGIAGPVFLCGCVLPELHLVDLATIATWWSRWLQAPQAFDTNVDWAAEPYLHSGLVDGQVSLPVSLAQPELSLQSFALGCVAFAMCTVSTTRL